MEKIVTTPKITNSYVAVLPDGAVQISIYDKKSWDEINATIEINDNGISYKKIGKAGSSVGFVVFFDFSSLIDPDDNGMCV